MANMPKMVLLGCLLVSCIAKVLAAISADSAFQDTEQGILDKPFIKSELTMKVQYTGAALEKYFSLGPTLCQTVCLMNAEAVAGLAQVDAGIAALEADPANTKTGPDAMGAFTAATGSSAQYQGTVAQRNSVATQQMGANAFTQTACSCNAQCGCTGYNAGFQTWLGTENPSVIKILPATKLTKSSMGAGGSLARTASKLGQVQWNDKFADPTGYPGFPDQTSAAFQGYAAVNALLTDAGTWPALKADFEPQIDAHDQQSLTPETDWNFQQWAHPDDAEFDSDKYKALEATEFQTKMALAGTDPLTSTGSDNPAHAPANAAYTNAWYARLDYKQNQCPSGEQAYKFTETTIVSGAPAVSQWDPKERKLDGVDQHAAQYGHCGPCQASVPALKATLILGIVGGVVFAAMTILRVFFDLLCKSGGGCGDKFLKVVGLIGGLIGTAMYFAAFFVALSCPAAAGKRLDDFIKYNEADGLLVTGTTEKSVTGGMESGLLLIIVSAALQLVVSIVGTVVKFERATNGGKIADSE